MALRDSLFTVADGLFEAPRRMKGDGVRGAPVLVFHKFAGFLPIFGVPSQASDIMRTGPSA